MERIIVRHGAMRTGANINSSFERENTSVEKLSKLMAILEKLARNQFTGSVKINFSQGGISRIEKLEEILKKE